VTDCKEKGQLTAGGRRGLIVVKILENTSRIRERLLDDRIETEPQSLHVIKKRARLSRVFLTDPQGVLEL
jgi:hypothetical protein